MNTWFERVRRTLLEVPPPVVVFAAEEWGLRRVIAGLRDPEQPLILLDARDLDCDDPITVGNALSEALRRGLGSALFGLGVEAEYAFSVLKAFLPALEPITVAITNAESCPQLAVRLAELVCSPNRLVVHACTTVADLRATKGSQLSDVEELGLTVEEALELFGAERSAEAIKRAVTQTRGALIAIEQALDLDHMVHANYDSAKGTIGKAIHDGASGVIDALIGRRRWIEAFEFAVDHAPTRLVEVIDEAGNAYFEAGEFDRFWRYVSDVPQWVMRQEQFMYWLFNAALAVNKWRPLLPRIDAYLGSHEAPDLRALRAMAELNERSLAEASRAYETRRSPDTARALAFIKEFRGEFRDANRLYKQAIELAEAEARPRQIVGAAAGMAQAHLFAGRYERAEHWGTWALQQYQNHELREELLRLLVTSTACYPRILIGRTKAARQILDTVRVREEMLGIPSLEGIVSTLGDLAIVERRYEDAVALYKKNLDASPRAIYAHLANDLVQGYLLLGDVPAAIGVAEKSSELGGASGSYQEYVAELSLGCALVHVDSKLGEAHLRKALNGLSRQPLGPFNAQAAIHLAASLLRRGRQHDAKAVLEENGEFIRELGDSGWQLLGGDGPEIARLKALFRHDEPRLKISLLGKRTVRGRDGEASLSLRFAELIAVLAANPEGTRGEQLAVALYGDRANPSTLKATISRARKVVPIDPLPYRIAEGYEADFVKVLALLQEGKVQAALELYRGPLLPESEAPAVVELREHLEESLRQAVLASGDADAMIDLANQQGDDLELWEETRRHLPPNDPRRPLANARIRRIRKRWSSEVP